MLPVYPITPSPIQRTTALIAAVLLAAPLLAGCLGDVEESEKFVGSSEGGFLFMGADYGAQTREALNATLEVDLNAILNTGRIVATGKLPDNTSFSVEATEYVAGADFHDGGIVANIVEHGDSGLGNPNWPAMHVLVASWGKGVFTKDGNETIDPSTGDSEWSLHLMVTDTGVRDDESGMILKSDGTSPYDPNTPGDATIGNDMEAHLVVSTLGNGTSRDPISLTENGDITATSGSRQPFDVPAGLANIEVTIELEDTPAAQGGYSFQLLDPDDMVQDSTGINTLTQGRTVTLSVENVTNIGAWTIASSPTTATPASYTAAIEITFSAPPTYYFFWEDVDVVQRVTS